jgi:hypothetical protein
LGLYTHELVRALVKVVAASVIWKRLITHPPTHQPTIMMMMHMQNKTRIA